VTDPSLAAAVQRASKALSFTPLVPDVTKRVLGLDPATVTIVRQHLDPEPGEPRGFLADMHDMVYTYLGPGADLNDLSLSAATELARQLDDYAAGLASPAVVVDDLLVWVRHFVAQGTARFLYGERNPLAQDPSLEACFWDFDHGLGGLLMGIAPSITARRAHSGRERLSAALADYLSRGEHAAEFGASRIVRERIAITEKHGWTTEAAGRCELSFLFAGIVNTATTTFWTVLHVFSRADLLAAVRSEIAANAIVPPGEDGGEKKEERTTVRLDALKTSCPTLLAVMRECLRLGSDNYSTRLVKADTLLAGQHHLAGGSVVQIAGGVIHADRSIWGADAADFDPSRFLEPPQQQQARHPAAFRAFGGGRTLCPGRHFATNEILAFVAMIVLRFDVEAVGGGEGIAIPGKDDGVLPVHILEPREPVRVVVRVREGVSGIKVV